MSRFTLERGRWYAWTMYPGYGDGPYHSPIFVNEVKAVGGRRFRLTFFNAGYASGVQGFDKTLKTVVREAEYLAAIEELSGETRLCVIHHVDHGWLHRHWRNWLDQSPPSDGENVQTYLTRRFGGPSG